MDTMNIFDLLILGCGIYLVYSALTMKKTGKIAAGVLLSKDVDADKIKDKAGFIQYMFSKLLGLGILTCVAGAWGLIAPKLNASGWVTLIGWGCYMVCLVLFAVSANKAKKKFV